MNDEKQPLQNEKELKRKEWIETFKKFSAFATMSTFPKGSFEIGGKKISNEDKTGFTIHPIQELQKNGEVTLDKAFWVQLLQTVSQRTFPEQNSSRPNNVDCVGISDIFDINLEKLTLPKELENMVAVTFSRKREDEKTSALIHYILLPKDKVSQFVKDLLADPDLIREISKDIFSGVDEIAPTQKREKLVVSINIRKNKMLGQLTATKKKIEIPH